MKPLEQTYEDIRSYVLDATYFWQELENLFYRSEDRMKLLLETAPNFFECVHQAYLHRVILSLSRLQDKARFGTDENYSFAYLIEQCHLHGKDTLANELQSKIDHLRYKSKNITHFRHKRLGHNDLKTFNDKLSPGSFREIGECLVLFQEFIDRVSYELFPDLGHCWEIASHGGSEAVVRYLKDAKSFERLERQNWTLANELSSNEWKDA